MKHSVRCEKANPKSKCKCKCEGKMHGIAYRVHIQTLNSIMASMKNEQLTLERWL